MFNLVNHAIKWLNRLELMVLILVLLSAIGIAVVDMFMRIVAGGGLVWAQPVVRILVLWMGLLGALLATRSNEHITVDVLSQFFSHAVRRWLNLFVYVFSGLVCGTAAWHCARFVLGSYEFADVVLTNTPAWCVQIIMPFTFALMAVRFFIHAVRSGLGYEPASAQKVDGLEEESAS